MSNRSTGDFATSASTSTGSPICFTPEPRTVLRLPPVCRATSGSGQVLRGATRTRRRCRLRRPGPARMGPARRRRRCRPRRRRQAGRHCALTSKVRPLYFFEPARGGLFHAWRNRSGRACRTFAAAWHQLLHKTISCPHHHASDWKYGGCTSRRGRARLIQPVMIASAMKAIRATANEIRMATTSLRTPFKLCRGAARSRPSTIIK